MKIIIRKTRLSDYKAIRGLLKKSELSGKWFTKRLFSNLLKKNMGFYFVAEVDGKVVGNIFSSHDGGYYGYIYKVAVESGFRKQKIATRLVEAAIDALSETGVDWFFVHVRKRNKASIGLFKSLGFKVKLQLFMANY